MSKQSKLVTSNVLDETIFTALTDLRDHLTGEGGSTIRREIRESWTGALTLILARLRAARS